MGNSTSTTIPSLPSAASQPAFIVVLQLRVSCRQIANIVNALKETNLIYRENTHNKYYERVGAISLFCCSLPIQGNNLRVEYKNQIRKERGRVHGWVFASLAPFSHFETMFIHCSVIAWQLSLVYRCERPKGAEDSLCLCSASIETQRCIREGTEKRINKAAQTSFICYLADFRHLRLNLWNIWETLRGMCSSKPHLLIWACGICHYLQRDSALAWLLFWWIRLSSVTFKGIQ